MPQRPVPADPAGGAAPGDTHAKRHKSGQRQAAGRTTAAESTQGFAAHARGAIRGEGLGVPVGDARTCAAFACCRKRAPQGSILSAYFGCIESGRP